jgi:toxin secretion/phage lysis holin
VGQLIGVVTVWSEQHPMISVLLWVMLIDIGTGLWKAWILKQLSSSISRKGLTVKFGILVSLALCILIDPFIELALTDIGAGFFVVSEALSIIENLIQMGVPFPPIIKERFEDWRKTFEKQTGQGVTAIEVKAETAMVEIKPGKVEVTEHEKAKE